MVVFIDYTVLYCYQVCLPKNLASRKYLTSFAKVFQLLSKFFSNTAPKKGVSLQE